jgi:hypothetical protein
VKQNGYIKGNKAGFKNPAVFLLTGLFASQDKSERTPFAREQKFIPTPESNFKIQYRRYLRMLTIACLQGHITRYRFATKMEKLCYLILKW